jgi:hypothetical protein
LEGKKKPVVRLQRHPLIDRFSPELTPSRISAPFARKNLYLVTPLTWGSAAIFPYSIVNNLPRILTKYKDGVKYQFCKAEHMPCFVK